MKASTVGRRRFVSKFTSGWIGTQSKLAKWHNRISDTCPRCKEHKEDVRHVIVCKDPTAALQWFQHINQLQKWMLKQDVEPDIASTLCQCLNSWKLGLAPLWKIQPTHSCYRAVLQQSYIGWFNLLGGLIGTEWVYKQERYYMNKHRKKSSVVLWSRITRKLWDIYGEQWSFRSEQIHRAEAKETSEEIQLINNTIREEYSWGLDALPQRFSTLFSQPLETLLQKRIGQRKQWVHSVLLLRSQYRTRIAEADEGRKFLRRWLGLREGR